MAPNQRLLLAWAWAILPLILLVLFPLPIESRSTPPSSLHHLRHHQPFQFIKKLQGCHKGETVKGLHQLKQYLERFGYLPHHSSTKDDDSFDDLLESAIKSYQHNFHLNVTGDVDSATAQQMMTPRCGVVDVVDGKTSVGSSKGRQLGAAHLHAISHYSFFPNSPRWPPSKTHLTYAFLDGVQVIDIQDLRSICARAFGKWQKVSHFTFQEAHNVNAADIKIGFLQGSHGDSSPFDGEGGVLAHAYRPTIGLFHFDADERWGINPSSTDFFDVESVAVHEIGHLLGLHHSTDPNAVMYPTIPPGQKKVSLGSDDIRGIKALYNL